MAQSTLFLFFLFFAPVFFFSVSSRVVPPPDVPFSSHYRVNWGQDHVYSDDGGWTTHVKLDNSSGGGFQSHDKYMFGYSSMRMKLVPGFSAGLIVAFYMSSLSPNHDEIDFEFLGTVPGEPWILLTNIFTNGTGEKEQMFYLWFDPTEDFHTYSFVWNRGQIVWYVDAIPIRIYRNAGAAAATYPAHKPMWLCASLWTADWVTQGGRVKINYTEGPFVASYKGFVIEGCKWEDPEPSRCLAKIEEKWWGKTLAYTLNHEERQKYNSVKGKIEAYNYCKDRKRFPKAPSECLVSPW